MRRVVITGLGVVSPLADGVEASWDRLINGQSGISKIDSFDASDLACQIGGMVPKGEGDGEFNIDKYVDVKERKKMDEFVVYAMAAADQAVADAGWTPSDEESLDRTGVMIGSGIGGLVGITNGHQGMVERGPRRLSPFYIPSNLINIASGFVSIKYGYRGPNHSVVTACATGTHAIGDAARMVAFDDADVMIAGGTEAAVSRIGMAGFAAARALSTQYNDTPEKASRPWDQGRDGFVMGEGAGIVVLEEYEHAKKRGAKIYAEVIGYGMSGDANHITAPAEDGNGGFRAMQAAIKRAEINPSDIDYINAHGTSTPLGDKIEHDSVKRMLGNAAETTSMSSTKSAIGHLLGAAGAVEAIFCAKAIETQVCPPTLNLDNPTEGCDLDLIPHTAKERKVDVVLSNSFGFGGTNASLIMRKVA